MKLLAFTLHNPKHHASLLDWPEEDSFKYYQSKNKTIIAVADGITRDPLHFSTLPDYKTTIGEIEFALEYPIPSPARKAADLFCESFISSTKKSKTNLASLKKAMIHSNHKIKLLNKNLKVDYLENDFAACVASAGIISNNTLYYSFITDCGLCIFNKNGKLKFITKNERPSPKISKELIKEPKKYGANWRDPRWRARTRKHYRNNPKEPLSYGALTGENTAIHFTRFGKQKINNGDFIIFYSDGMFPILTSKKFNITKHFQNLENYIKKHSKNIGGSEGTLIAIQF